MSYEKNARNKNLKKKTNEYLCNKTITVIKHTKTKKQSIKHTNTEHFSMYVDACKWLCLTRKAIDTLPI